jgi:hypothetical protein
METNLTNPGLCGRCTHVQLIPSARGTTYYLCRLALTDARFAKYPRLPVLSCLGFVQKKETAEERRSAPSGPSEEITDSD